MPAIKFFKEKGVFEVRVANTHPTFTNQNPSDCASLQKFQKIQKDPFPCLICGILDRRKGESQMDNISIILMLAGFVLSFCCAINAIRGKPNKKTWYWMIAAYIGFGVCYAASQRDARNIGIAFMLICFCYIVKVVWGFLKAAIKHEKYHCKKDLLVLIAVFVLFIVGMMLPYDKAAAAQRAAESEAREIEKAASSAAAASSKAEAERQKQAESEAAASRDVESKRLKEEAESKAASDSKKAEDERNAAIKAESERLAAEVANSKKEEPTSKEQSASEKAKEEKRNAAIRAESEKQSASSKSSSKPKKSSSSSSEQAVTDIDFNAVYKEYKSNEVRAEETYGNKRYRVTGTVNGLTDSGLANLFGGATVTLVRQVGNTTVYFFASFSKDQKDAIMKINTGDEITFVGEYSKMSFYSCELESYTRDGKTVKIY